MAAKIVAGRSYSNWIGEICQKKKYTLQGVVSSYQPTDGARSGPAFENVVTVHDFNGAKLHETRFTGDSKQKAKQGAALAMVREMGYTDDMLEELSRQPKKNGELPRHARKAMEAQELGEVDEHPAVPYVEELIQDLNFDYISDLKKLCAIAGLPKPAYEDVDASGPAHHRAFKMSGKIGGRGVVPKFTAEAYATGKKKHVKNLCAYYLWLKVKPEHKNIRQKMLDWAAKSPGNKQQLPVDFFMDLEQTADQVIEVGVQNLDIHA